MAVTQETIQLKVNITALDPEEEFDVEATMIDVAHAIEAEFPDMGYAVTVGHDART